MANSDFERAVKRARRKQLVWTNEASQRLDRILKSAANDVADQLKKHIGTGSIQERYLQGLLADLNRVIDNFRGDFSRLLSISLYGAAQIAIDGQVNIAQLVLDEIAMQTFLQGLLPTMTRSETIQGIGVVGVSFGHVAESAVESIYNRVFRDGLTLSDRIWRLDSQIRAQIEDTLIRGIAEQKSARDLARELRKYLTETGLQNGRYNSQRLARTEINTAHREGHIRSATKSDGTLRDHISALGYRLSASHPRPDICDVWASQDADGLGSGNYLPENVPQDHANGLCYLVSILKSYPDLQFVTVQPKPDEVPESQLRYYNITR